MLAVAAIGPAMASCEKKEVPVRFAICIGFPRAGCSVDRNVLKLLSKLPMMRMWISSPDLGILSFDSASQVYRDMEQFQGKISCQEPRS